MLGRRDPQHSLFSAANLPHRVPTDSFYGRMAIVSDVLFQDDDLKELCEGAVSRLASLTTVKGLRGLDNLLLALLPIGGLGFILAAPFWQSEAVAVLAAVSWLVILGMKKGGAAPRQESPPRDGNESRPEREGTSYCSTPRST